MKADYDSRDFNVARAEVFDAISHPVRIKILQALRERQMGFAELKRTVGIESSGHLDFHLTKLRHFVKTSPEGTYALTDDGREALWSVSALKKSENGTNFVSHIPWSTRRHRVVIAAFLIAVLLTSSVALYQQQVAISQAATISNLQGQVSALVGFRDSLIANVTALSEERAVLLQLSTALQLSLCDLEFVSAEQRNQVASLKAQISTLKSQLVALKGASFRTFDSNFTTNSLGELSLTGSIDGSGYNRVSVWIIQWPTKVSGLTVQVVMGRTNAVVDTFPLGARSYTPLIAPLHTYDVTGPDFRVLLTGGPPDTPIGIQAWVYFH